MAWYLEHEKAMGKINTKIKLTIDLDCPNNLLAYEHAKKIARDIAQKKSLLHPKLIWLEPLKIDES